jgi:UDP-N-acetylmuramate dehydrogenase
LSQESIEKALVNLKAALGDRVRKDVAIARFTSFRLGGPAALMVECNAREDLTAVAAASRAHGLETLVLGKGTNVLISDRGFDGVVVRLSKGFDFIDDEGMTIKAGGITQLPRVANRAAKRGLTGLEFAIAIPATVGGAVRMNAGAHGKAVADVLDEAEVFDLAGGIMRTLKPSDLSMSYRHSALSSTDIVCSAGFQLTEGNPDKILKRMEEYREHRSRTQPVDAPNAGSMFKNPPNDSAGRLIEEAGLKGLRVGGAEVSQKHGNFFLAHRGSTSQDVHDLMARVQKAIHEKFGVLLLPEVWTIGKFDREEELQKG